MAQAGVAMEIDCGGWNCDANTYKYRAFWQFPPQTSSPYYCFNVNPGDKIYVEVDSIQSNPSQYVAYVTDTTTGSACNHGGYVNWGWSPYAEYAVELSASTG